jgi:hypothetical protein
LPEWVEGLVLEDNAKNKLLLFLHFLEGPEEPIPNYQQAPEILVQHVQIATFEKQNEVSISNFEILIIYTFPK